MSRLGLVAGLLGMACGVLPACTDAGGGVPEIQKITVAVQDTTPPQFAAFVAIENGQQLTPPTTQPTTGTATGFATTVGPGMNPTPRFRVFTPGDDLAILVNAFDDESGVQKIEVFKGKGTNSCSDDDDDLATTSGPGLGARPPAPGKNANVSPGDEVPRVEFAGERIAVGPGEIHEVGIRVTDNFGNVSQGHFRVDMACRAS
jgi:hypothetical protein